MPMDLGRVQVELKLREEKIKALFEERKKYKGLLMKAKQSIESTQARNKQLQEQIKSQNVMLQEAIQRNKDLTTTLEIFQSKRNGIQSKDIKAILARVKVQDVGYTLIESKECEVEWYKDSQIINV